jgi:hypothetical protein
LKTGRAWGRNGLDILRETEGKQAMSVDTSGGHPEMDYAEHNRTYRGFIRGTIITTVLVAATLVMMVIFLV